jgi:arsenate reductase (glutaredoxin)
MTKHVRMYWMAKCSTCQKAKAFLEELGVTFTLIHDMKESPLPMETIQELATAVGGIEALFSKRSMKFRQWGLHEKTLSEADMLGYMGQDYTFIKRPVLVFDDGTAFAGWAPKKVGEYLNNA